MSPKRTPQKYFLEEKHFARRAGATRDDKRLILVDPSRLRVGVSEVPDDKFAAFPVAWGRSWCSVPLVCEIAWGLMFDEAAAQDRKQGRFRAYKADVPDAWLAGLAWLMWQGIIQGLAWDSMKLIVARAVRVLRKHELAPLPKPQEFDLETATELGFTWEEYARDEALQRRLFFGLKRTYKSMSGAERAAALEPKRLPAPKKLAKRRGTRHK